MREDFGPDREDHQVIAEASPAPGKRIHPQTLGQLSQLET